MKYVVLNDSQGGAPKRKLEQTKAAAAAEGKTMAEFLAKFGYKEYPGDDAMLADLLLEGPIGTGEGDHHHTRTAIHFATQGTIDLFA